ncbi:hypothetical protein LXH13_36925 [Streptomyces spinosirectus]|jgi:hypothetical protein|uniref:hypothetical protein n=1 Tax=Streptomyces TaxID=1883 RepID=UPI000D3573F5|nr:MULTISPECIES: hypothetical protein [Streptomyces]MBY8341107.1 hypothetical protein [Streptomyces plumbidurans]PTM90049.1 hypothetical protein C7821_112262 [Streptomyces sp. VMFN-G11Ma]UIR22280.1 hypothetical protein LXH13_36925 [Streptomyces spinosirectus]
MSEGDIDAGAPFSDAARARLAMAYEACELSDLARAAVPIGERELRRDGTPGTPGAPGAALARAAQVLLAARRLLDAAVVFERTRGATWDAVGSATGTSAHTARKRFAQAETRFRQALHSPESPGAMGVTDPATVPGATTAPDHLTWWRSHLIRHPLEAALDLDDWVLRHKEGDDDLGAAPVSGAVSGRYGTAARNVVRDRRRGRP